MYWHTMYKVLIEMQIYALYYLHVHLQNFLLVQDSLTMSMASSLTSYSHSLSMSSDDEIPEVSSQQLLWQRWDVLTAE